MNHVRVLFVAALTLGVPLLTAPSAGAQGTPPASGGLAGSTIHQSMAPRTPAPPMHVNVARMPLAVTTGTTTITVNTTTDPASCPDAAGAVSLRCAISAADGLSSAIQKVIAFHIPATDPGCSPQTIQGQSVSVCVIEPANSLPEVTNDLTTINGYSQPGAVANTNPITAGDNAILTIQLDGSLFSQANVVGILLAGTQDSVRGISLTNFGFNDRIDEEPAFGFYLQGTNERVSGDYVGLSPSGSVGYVGHDVVVYGSGNFVGGTSLSARNVEAGVPSGGGFAAIQLQGPGNWVQGNMVGTDPSGTTPIPNDVGIEVLYNGNDHIGGASGAGNLVSGNAGDGISVDVAGVTVQGNYIGTTASGMAALGNSGNGIVVYASGDTISHNVVSANGGDGVFLDNAQNSTVQGNYIGTNASGMAALGNSGNGIMVGSSADTIGHNVISGNGGHGVFLASGQSSTIQGNKIGTNTTGSASLANKGDGIFGQFAGNMTIGGSTTTTRNIISGNGQNGVELTGGSSNLIGANFIGLTAGKAPLANALNGVYLHDGEHGDTVGVGGTGSPNVIADNGGNGVLIGASDADATTVGNLIRGNSIYHNPLGISLNGEYPSSCTTGFSHGSAPNDYLPCPIITSASTLTISGTAYPNSFVDVFIASTTTADAGYGEGKTYVGSAISDGAGNWTFNPTVGKVATGQLITATTTNGDLQATPETSEFGPNITVQ